MSTNKDAIQRQIASDEKLARQLQLEEYAKFAARPRREYGNVARQANLSSPARAKYTSQSVKAPKVIDTDHQLAVKLQRQYDIEAGKKLSPDMYKKPVLALETKIVDKPVPAEETNNDAAIAAQLQYDEIKRAAGGDKARERELIEKYATYTIPESEKKTEPAEERKINNIYDFIDKYKDVTGASMGTWLNDNQLTDLLIANLSSTPGLELYDINARPLGYGVEAPGKKVILIEGGVTNHNIGDVVSQAQRQLDVVKKDNPSLNIAEYSFAVPVNLGTPAPEQLKNSDANKDYGAHWVMATLHPVQKGPDISYNLIYADSMHNSNDGATISPVAAGENGIATKLRDAGVNIAEVLDISTGQQRDGWTCGYQVAQTMQDLLSNFAQVEQQVIAENKSKFSNRYPSNSGRNFVDSLNIDRMPSAISVY